MNPALALTGLASPGLALIDGWVHPALVAGTALAVVPLAIHLLNRQRHRPMRWAAMRFVIAAYRRTRRRARLEELLLLLLRMAVVALLALAIARPFAGAESPLAGLTESRRDLVLIVDGSASTGYRDSVDSVFERIVARSREVLLELEGERGDRVRLVMAGAHPRLLSWRTPEEALSVLGTLVEPTDEPLDLAAALAELEAFAKEDTGVAAGALEVRLLTDLQRASFVPPMDRTWDDTGGTADGAADVATGESANERGGSAVVDRAADAGGGRDRSTLAQVLDALEELGVTVLVEDHGPPDQSPPNLGILAVEPLAAPIGPGAPFDVAVTVGNQGASARMGVRVVLMEDGERRPVQTIEVAPREVARAVFPVSFSTPGPHTLEAQIEVDRLTVDDRRACVVVVPPPMRVLLVNGAPSDRIEDDEVGLLAAVLEPIEGDGGIGAARPFVVRRIEPDELQREDVRLADFDVIVLANVESLSPAVVPVLEERVAAGAGLWISAGDRLDAERWNDLFWRADQSGLLPAELGGRNEVRERRTAYWRVREFDEVHPALAFFADERWRGHLTEVPIYGFLSAEPQENARVLARLDDDEGRPLLIEKRYDRGRVLLWTSTLDPAWTLLPELPRTLVPLVHETLRHLGAPTRPAHNLEVGGSIVAEVGLFPRTPSIVLPDASRRPLDGEPAAAGPGRWRLPAFDETDRAGLYRVDMEGDRSIPFAVQIDAKEGDLERMAAAELSALHPALVLASASGEGPDGDEAPVQGELWRGLALAALVALILESIWAAFLGYRRSRIA